MLPIDLFIRTFHVGKFLKKCTQFKTQCCCSSSRVFTSHQSCHGAAYQRSFPSEGLVNLTIVLLYLSLYWVPAPLPPAPAPSPPSP